MEQLRYSLREAQPELLPNSMFEPWHLFDMEPMEHSNECNWRPVANIFEREDRIEVFVELPGMSKKDIKVNLSNNILTVTGERIMPEGYDCYCRVESQYGTFCRSFSLADTIDPTGIDAKFDKGILKIVLPKTEQSKPRQVQVTGG